MRGLLYRLAVLLWFLSYMAVIYLALHVLVSRVSRRPGSRLQWFFSIVTAPLTRPVRVLLPPGTTEPRLRLVALAVYAALWLLMRLVLSGMGGVALG